jgi:multimeric flavodoxin WrbA
MKITAFVGSSRKKGNTYKFTEQLLHSLQSFGEIEYEIVILSDYQLEVCRGCKFCFLKGEEYCPLKDDRDKLIEKMSSSDGIIFSSPNYSFSLSGQMKVFLDRLGYVFHRPCFFGKVFINIVVQGFYGGTKIVKYFNFIGEGLGFNIVKGSCLTALEPMTEKEQIKIDRVIERQSRIFYSKLIRKENPAPGLFKLMIFRMSRTSIKLLLNESNRDYAYFRKKGWFESEYYYPVQSGPFMKLTGRFFDLIFYSIYKKKTGNLN